MFYRYLVLVIIFFTAMQIFAQDEDEVRGKLPKLLGSNNAGTKFFVTLPPGYEEIEDRGSLQIYIVSKDYATVTISSKAGYNRTLSVEPYEVQMNDIPREIAIPTEYYPTLPVPQANVYKGKSIKIQSTEPIVVYVILRFPYTSDGFLAIPVSSWGMEYIAATTPEISWNENLRFPPFIAVIGAHDGTTATLKMGGGNQLSQIETSDGRILSTGELWQFTLDEGDVMLAGSMGNGADLTGTKIQSDKPVGMVVAHYCANIPFGNGWCDYSAEMSFPTDTWSTTFHVPFMPDRLNYPYVTILAKEANTNVYVDGVFRANIAIPGGGSSLQNAYWNGRLMPLNTPLRAVTITADKPISVMFLNPGSQEDQKMSDPFYMQLVPTEQYHTEAAWGTPYFKSKSIFETNRISFFFESDAVGTIPADIEFADLSITDPVWKPFVSIVQTQGQTLWKDPNDPNAKQYAFVNYNLPKDGVYGLRSAITKFMVYSSGNGDYTAYGYPTSSLLLNMEAPEDKDVPAIVITANKGTEIMGNIDDGADNSSKLSVIHFLQDVSSNCTFELEDFVASKDSKANWKINITDKNKDATAFIYFSDRNGNDKLIKYAISASSVETYEESNQIEIYPNPISDNATINFNDLLHNDSKAYLVEMNTGKEVYQFTNLNSQMTFSVNSLQSGMYLLVVKSQDKSYFKKVVINK